MKFQTMIHEAKMVRRGTFQNKISLVNNAIDKRVGLCLPELSLPSLLLLLFIWGPHWVFVAASGLSLIVVSRAALRCPAQASHCGGSPYAEHRL